MKFDHPDYKDVSFELSDKWTVRTTLAYDSAMDHLSDPNMYVRLWEALQAVLAPEDWKCEDISLDASFDEKGLSGKKKKKLIETIKWAGTAGWSVRYAQDADEKN